jgi:hypothetical protein
VRQSFAKQIFDVVNLLTQQFQLAREAFDLKLSPASNFMKQPSGGPGRWGLEVRGEPELGLSTPSSKELARSKQTLSAVNMCDAGPECKSATGVADMYLFRDQFVQKVAKI